MQSNLGRTFRALCIALLCQLLFLVPSQQVFAGGDDDDSAADDDDTASDDDDTASDDDDDDDDSSAGESLDSVEVPYEDRELGGGCACAMQDAGSAGAGGLLLGLMFLSLYRRRRTFGS